MTDRATVIIPAHDEEESLPANLRLLLAGAGAEEFEVVVVANGCGDATADAARRMGAEFDIPLQVVEIPQASKAAALNVGDGVAAGFPRVYLDADVECRTSTLRSLLGALRAGPPELALATRRLDLVHASWWVREYYRAWQLLPRVQEELAGRGAYAFSREGRERFDQFPAIIADDYWAVRQVPRDRAVVVPEEIVIRPPMNIASLVRVRSRIYAANRSAGIPDGGGSPRAADISSLVKEPRSWLAAGVFLGTNAYIKMLRVRRQRGYGRDPVRGLSVTPCAATRHVSPDRTDDSSV